MKKIITIIFLAFPVFAFADMKLAEQCHLKLMIYG